MRSFHPLEVVCHSRETQLQVGYVKSNSFKSFKYFEVYPQLFKKQFCNNACFTNHNSKTSQISVCYNFFVDQVRCYIIADISHLIQCLTPIAQGSTLVVRS